MQQSLARLTRVLSRETHVLARAPELLAAHLHNSVLLDEGEEGPAEALLARARVALADRDWSRLRNRPELGGSRKPLRRLLEHEDSVISLAWSPRGRLLATGGLRGTLSIWDATDGSLEVAVETTIGALEGLAWSPGERRLALGAGSVAIFDLASRTLGPPLSSPGGSVRSLGWSPDGKLLAWTGADRGGCLWEVATDAVRPALEGMTAGRVSALAWSPDGRLLIWVDELRSGYLVTPATRNVDFVITGGSAEVSVLAWSPGGALLASAQR